MTNFKGVGTMGTILDLLNEYFGTEAKTLEEFDQDFINISEDGMPIEIYRFFKFVQLKEV